MVDILNDRMIEGEERMSELEDTYCHNGETIKRLEEELSRNKYSRIQGHY